MRTRGSRSSGPVAHASASVVSSVDATAARERIRHSSDGTSVAIESDVRSAATDGLYLVHGPAYDAEAPTVPGEHRWRAQVAHAAGAPRRSNFLLDRFSSTSTRPMRRGTKPTVTLAPTRYSGRETRSSECRFQGRLWCSLRRVPCRMTREIDGYAPIRSCRPSQHEVSGVRSCAVRGSGGSGISGGRASSSRSGVDCLRRQIVRHPRTGSRCHVLPRGAVDPGLTGARG